VIEFDEDFLKEVFNGKSSHVDNFELFVPSTYIYLRLSTLNVVCIMKTCPVQSKGVEFGSSSMFHYSRFKPR